ncbi:transketolase [Caloramator quimbayensis]|uniref:Transketolase n=1 Tax=Caloramator quimbayensis TaxID=1147123 RepID=A0A1T4XVT8_9CLOT|nr:transketolase [Caloramator quimbayensis]SKA93640.1 transketolase [Caloramator quimbayensis]
MNENEIKQLELKSKHVRRLIIDEIGKLGVGHIGGCLSPVEALVVLYYKVMNIDPKNPDMEGRDRFVLSKGHAGPALYAVLADKGYFDISMLDTLNRPETNLPSHCDMLKTRGIDMTTGSLGQGISCAVGMAKASKILKDNAYIYCMIGDGESQEGQVWEAAMAAAHFKLDNLIAFTDYNKLQIDGTVDEVMSLLNVEEKWKAFGWNVYSVDGHDINEIYNALLKSKETKGKPSMIILNTIKGKGVSFIENMGAGNHNTKISNEQRIAALKELE